MTNLLYDIEYNLTYTISFYFDHLLVFRNELFCQVKITHLSVVNLSFIYITNLLVVSRYFLLVDIDEIL